MHAYVSRKWANVCEWEKYANFLHHVAGIQWFFKHFPPFSPIAFIAIVCISHCFSFFLEKDRCSSLSICSLFFLGKSSNFKLESSSERGSSVSLNAAIILSPTFTLQLRESSYEAIKIVGKVLPFLEGIPSAGTISLAWEDKSAKALWKCYSLTFIFLTKCCIQI